MFLKLSSEASSTKMLKLGSSAAELWKIVKRDENIVVSLCGRVSVETASEYGNELRG